MGLNALGGRSREEVEDIVGAMAEAGVGLEYDDAQGLIAATRRGPNPYDAAQSFAEGGLTLSRSNVNVTNGSLNLSPNTIEAFQDSTVASQSELWTFVATTGLTDFGGGTGNLQADAGTASTVGVERDSPTTNNFEFSHRQGVFRSDYVLYDFKEGNTSLFDIRFDDSTQEIRTNGIKISNFSDSYYYDIRIEPDFPGDQYEVFLNDSSEGTFGFKTSASGYDYFDIRNDNLNGSGGRTCYIDHLREGVDATSGSATLEWPHPADIYEWDVATFTRSPDGETVDVFVAYSTDGGSTWSRANGGVPISRNYSLAGDADISASDEVRIEVELSRADTANNPTLDSAYRSWRV